MTNHFDCLIIGGGPAGLTGAIYLARFRRNVIVADAGQSRAALIPKSRNYPGFPYGTSGKALLSALRKQARHYDIETRAHAVTNLKIVERKFHATLGGAKITSSSVLLATGLTDHAPKIDGLRKAVAETIVKYCPVCDAFESIDERIAVLGSVNDVESKAHFLRSYSKSVTILAVGKRTPGKKILSLKRSGIEVFHPVAMRIRNHGVEATNVDGEKLRVDAVYPMLGCDIHSKLATGVGAKCNKQRGLIVDSHQQTSVVGLYAAGDVVSDLHQISVATGHAAIAATAIHNNLPENMR